VNRWGLSRRDKPPAFSGLPGLAGRRRPVRVADLPIAPLNAALLVAARQVPPFTEGLRVAGHSFLTGVGRPPNLPTVLRMKRFLTLALVAATIGAVIPARADLIDGIVAVANESVITFQQVNRLVAMDDEILRSQYRNDPDMLRQKRNELQGQAEEGLIENQLIVHEFRDTVKIPESILDDVVQDEIHSQYGSDRTQLYKKLQIQGTTMEDFRNEVRDRIIVAEMVRKFVPEPIISPVKLEDYYVAHSADYKLEDQVRMRMIMLNKGALAAQTQKRAQEIVSLLNGGASFAELARVYSEDSMRAQGGEREWQNVSAVNSTLQASLKELKPGQHSGVIDTADSCYVILLEERRPAQIKPLSEVRDEIEKTLKVAEQSRRHKEWIERLKKKYWIRFY